MDGHHSDQLSHSVLEAVWLRKKTELVLTCYILLFRVPLNRATNRMLFWPKCGLHILFFWRIGFEDRFVRLPNWPIIITVWWAVWGANLFMNITNHSTITTHESAEPEWLIQLDTRLCSYCTAFYEILKSYRKFSQLMFTFHVYYFILLVWIYVWLFPLSSIIWGCKRKLANFLPSVVFPDTELQTSFLLEEASTQGDPTEEVGQLVSCKQPPVFSGKKVNIYFNIITLCKNFSVFNLEGPETFSSWDFKWQINSDRHSIFKCREVRLSTCTLYLSIDNNLL